MSAPVSPVHSRAGVCVCACSRVGACVPVLCAPALPVYSRAGVCVCVCMSVSVRVCVRV